MEEADKNYLLSLPCPIFDLTPWVVPPQLSKCKIALISTGAIHLRGDRPFDPWASDYRVIPKGAQENNIIMSHISANFDRTGFQQDLNVIFPLKLLIDLAEKGIIGDVADYHYSFMGAPEPQKMESTARNIAKIMIKEKVNAVFLIPV